MREFEQIKQEKNLRGPKKWNGYVGAAYMVNLGPNYDTEEFLRIRHFDGPNYETEKQASVQISQEFRKWVSESGLSAIIFVEQPAEVGIDFIAFPNAGHAFFRSTFELDGQDELLEEQQAYQNTLPAVLEKWKELENTGNSAVLKRVIKHSILNVSDETYYDLDNSKLVVFEPIIQEQDVKEWQLA